MLCTHILVGEIYQRGSRSAALFPRSLYISDSRTFDLIVLLNFFLFFPVEVVWGDWGGELMYCGYPVFAVTGTKTAKFLLLFWCLLLVIPYLPQHFLYFFPLPQGHGSFRPIFLVVTGLLFSFFNGRGCSASFSSLNISLGI